MNTDKNKPSLYQNLPRIDALLDRYEHIGLARPYLKILLNDVLDRCRRQIQDGRISSKEQADTVLSKEIEDALQQLKEGPMKHVINGTGVILHTNLGRAIYDIPDLAGIASHYCNLEFDLETGERGSRNSHLDAYLRLLTGAEAAIVVNNNAAAVMLVLRALSFKKDVLVSRGEQVEIGGSFRIPDVAELSGANLREIGTTNRTRMSDYETHFSEETGMILRVEPSNYSVIGQVGRPTNEEIFEFTNARGIPYYIDLGSGVFDLDILRHVSACEIEKKNIRRAVECADIISFSGDKLLGSAQAGIIVGKKKYIDILAKHPLYRAMRLDKLSIYVLSETLKSALFQKKNLVTDMIMTSAEEVRKRVQSFIRSFRQNVTKESRNREFFKKNELILTLVPVKSGIGGGTFAISEIDSFGLKIKMPKNKINTVAKHLRTGTVPLIGRVEDDAIILDFRTIQKDEEKMLSLVLKNLLYNISFT